MSTSALLAHEKAAYASVDAPCRYFGACGGCSLQDLAYADQLALKHERLRLALGVLPQVPAFEVAGLEEPWRYRNRAEFSFGEQDGRLVLGYHAVRSFSRVVDLEDCLLLPEPFARLLNDTRALAIASGLPPYHPRTHQGFFRYLSVRQSRASQRFLLCLMTTAGPREAVERIADELLARQPDIAGLYWGLTSQPADVALPQELVLLRGDALLDDQVGPFRLRLHPLSFLQSNHAQADRMYQAMCQALRQGPRQVAWDLYCGVGLVGFYLAQEFAKVYAIDSEAHHRTLADENAALNGIRNIDCRAGHVETLLMDRRYWLGEGRPDAVVVDPPRVGLHPQALSSLLAARPPRIAYLSCNVHTLVRDLQILLSSYPRYRISALQAFDMFPQTLHAELLVVLERQ